MKQKPGHRVSYRILRAAFILLIGLALASCARPPEEKIAAAKAAVDRAMAEGLEKYAPAEAEALNTALAAALANVAAEEAAFPPRYTRSIHMLDKVISDAGQMTTGIPEKKEAARGKSDASVRDARQARDEARSSLHRFLADVSSLPDAERISSEFAAGEQVLAEAEQMMQEEDFLAAADKGLRAAERFRELMRTGTAAPALAPR